METTENESNSLTIGASGTNTEFQPLWSHVSGNTQGQSSAANFGGSVGFNQNQEESNSQLLEQMSNVSGLSFGESSSNMNTMFVTPAKMPTANTPTLTMAGRPRKKQRVKEFSFTDFEATERTRMRTMGTNEAQFDVAMSDDWNQKAEESFDLVHTLFPESQKPNSESAANVVDFLSTSIMTFKKSRSRNAAYPYVMPIGEAAVKLEFRTVFDDETCGSKVPAQQIQRMAELAQLRRRGVKEALQKVLQDASEEELNQEGDRGTDSVSRRVALFMAKALEEELNEQGAELGVMGNALISYPRTVQILAGYEGLQRESLIALICETGMGDHLMMSQQKQLLENSEGHMVRRFVEGFLAEFVETDTKFSEQLSKLKGPVCCGAAVPSMVSTMVGRMKTLALSKLPNSSVPQQQVQTQMGTQHRSTSTPGYVDALKAAAGQSMGPAANVISHQPRQHQPTTSAGMGMMGSALPNMTQERSTGGHGQGLAPGVGQQLDVNNTLSLGLGILHAEALQRQNEELARVLGLMEVKGLAGLETHHLKLVFQMHYEKLKQTAAQKSALNMDIVTRQVETKVVDAGDAEGVFVDCSGKPSLAIRVALLDFGNVDPTELLENIESSTQRTMSGWVVKSESTGKKAKGGLLRNKGMVDLALENLQVLLTGAWDMMAAFTMVQPFRLLMKQAKKEHMQWTVFLSLMGAAFVDVSRRAKQFASNSDTVVPVVGAWSEKFLGILRRAMDSCNRSRADQGILFSDLDPEWSSMSSADVKYPEQNSKKEPREPKEKKKNKQQYQQESQGNWGGKDGTHKWDGYCGFSKEFTDQTNGKCNHMQCPFWSRFYLCRDLHKGLEAHSGPNGRAATEEEYQAVKKTCQETWPDWRDRDTPPIPRPRQDRSKDKGKGKGKGKGS
jgi:hypothetical protein